MLKRNLKESLLLLTLTCAFAIGVMEAQIQPVSDHTYVSLQYTTQDPKETFGSISETFYGHKNLWKLLAYKNYDMLKGLATEDLLLPLDSVVIIPPASLCTLAMDSRCLQILNYIHQVNGDLEKQEVLKTAIRRDPNLSPYKWDENYPKIDPSTGYPIYTTVLGDTMLSIILQEYGNEQYIYMVYIHNAHRFRNFPGISQELYPGTDIALPPADKCLEITSMCPELPIETTQQTRTVSDGGSRDTSMGI